MLKATAALFSFGLTLLPAMIAGAASDPDAPPSRLAAVHPADAPPTPAPRAGRPLTARFRETYLELEQSATTQTLGVGRDYQSENPTYDVSLVLRPRFYIVDAADERETLSLRAVIAVVQELTDSDTTTRRNETLLTDLELWAAYTKKLWVDGPYTTELGLRLPWLTIPTSKASLNSGRILGLGTFASLSQTLPLLDDGDGWLEALILRFGAGYSYGFSRATVPTNPDFSRVRMDPEGESLPSDQLNGAALAQHTVLLRFIGELYITDRLKLGSDLSVRPAWKYPLKETELCGVVDTGCVEPRGLEDSTRHGVVTEYRAELEYQLADPFALSFGYANLALQLGPDGQRRTPFYSPDARFVLTFRAHLDKLVAPTPAAPSGARAKSGLAPISH